MPANPRIAELQAAIAAIDKTLAAGVNSYSVDGVTTSVDLAFLARHRSTLADELASLENPPPTATSRRLLNPVDLSRFAP